MKIDLTGQRFGWLTVVGEIPRTGHNSYWLCRCDCGNLVSARTDRLRAGLIKSCGCQRKRPYPAQQKLVYQQIEMADVLTEYERTTSVRATAYNLGISEGLVVKTLVSKGAYDSDTSQRVAALLDAGKTPDEIAKILGLSRSAVDKYIPYSRGSYTLGEKSENAKKIARWRVGKKVEK